MADTSGGRPVAVLKVADIDRTVAWYSAAGFAVRGRGDDPGTSWCEVARDGTVIQFLAGETPWPGDPCFTGCFYVHVDDLDRAFAELRDPVVSQWGIEEREWGPREVVLADPDDYLVTLTQAQPDGG
jgi:hypothetical protein